jgi:hypothetical protein
VLLSGPGAVSAEHPEISRIHTTLATTIKLRAIYFADRGADEIDLRFDLSIDALFTPPAVVDSERFSLCE